MIKGGWVRCIGIAIGFNIFGQGADLSVSFRKSPEIIYIGWKDKT